MRISRRSKLSLRAIAILYLTLLLLLPIGVVLVRTFEHGLGTAWNWMTTPAAISALTLSVVIALIAVPLNTVFGIGTAMVLVRGRGNKWAKSVLDTLIDLPFVVSPVIVGLALILVYGKDGWFGNWLIGHGITLIYNPAGMVIATVFVSLPFVVREVAPVLIEIGDEQEQAASTLGASSWQAFRRVTLPSIRWGVAYGVVLTTARALGEIGAVAVVSSNVPGSTLTLPLLVQQRDQDLGTSSITGAYAAATELAVMSLIVLLALTLLGPRRQEAR
ncbi:MAG TPA: sulfate ABC transporter permease subunit [Solirubrobacteraceae bacterium]